MLKAQVCSRFAIAGVILMPDPLLLKSMPSCPRCGSARTSRVRRDGWMQTLVLNRFGLYPWECSGCGKVFLFKSRGKLKRKRADAGEVHLPPVA